MAKLSRLINGQKLRFDTHQAGDRQPMRLPDLHMDKLPDKGGKIRFDFFGTAEPVVTGMSDERARRVIGEVRRALGKNPQLRDELAQTIVKQLQRFKNGSVSLADARAAARNIAKAFDLSEDFVTEVVRYNELGYVERARSLHLGHRPGSVYEIVQSQDGVLVQKPSDYWTQWRSKE
jgi:hypothetical protein